MGTARNMKTAKLADKPNLISSEVSTATIDRSYTDLPKYLITDKYGKAATIQTKKTEADLRQKYTFVKKIG